MPVTLFMGRRAREPPRLLLPWVAREANSQRASHTRLHRTCRRVPAPRAARFIRRLEPLLRPLGDHLHHGSLEQVGDRHPGDFFGFSGSLLRILTISSGKRARAGVEGAPTGDEGVNGGAQAVDVGSAAHRRQRCRRPLRRHVGDVASDLAGPGYLLGKRAFERIGEHVVARQARSCPRCGAGCWSA